MIKKASKQTRRVLGREALVSVNGGADLESAGTDLVEKFKETLPLVKR
jgi:hypothetical protein